jgi:hypothetical protein
VHAVRPGPPLQLPLVQRGAVRHAPHPSLESYVLVVLRFCALCCFRAAHKNTQANTQAGVRNRFLWSQAKGHPFADRWDLELSKARFEFRWWVRPAPALPCAAPCPVPLRRLCCALPGVVLPPVPGCVLLWFNTQQLCPVISGALQWVGCALLCWCLVSFPLPQF